MGKIVRFRTRDGPVRGRRTWHGAHMERGSATRGRMGGASLAEIRIMVLGGTLAGLVWFQFAPGFETSLPAADPNIVVPAVRFGLCHSGGGFNCVVDGDTFYSEGVKIRIADIDTPETHPPRCAEEAELGERATLRLQALLSEGAFELDTIDRDADIHGRKLRIAVRGGRSLGDLLVSEGLARPYGAGRRSWCA